MVISIDKTEIPSPQIFPGKWAWAMVTPISFTAPMSAKTSDLLAIC